MRFYPGISQHNRLHSDSQFLHRFNVATFRLPLRERRHYGIFLHHQDYETVQTDATFFRFENTHPNFPSVGQGAHSASIFPRVRLVIMIHNLWWSIQLMMGDRYSDICQFGVLRGTDTNESRQRFQKYTTGVMVGAGHYDDSRVWWHGAQNVYWNVCGRPLCLGRCADDSFAGARYCIKFCHVL